MFFLRTDEIDWIEAAGNYVRLHLGEDSHLFRETMNNMEARLDGRRFVRIHRSRIVNTDRIKELQPWFNGEYVVVLHNGDPPDAEPRLSRKIAGAAGQGVLISAGKAGEAGRASVASSQYHCPTCPWPLPHRALGGRHV